MRTSNLMAWSLVATVILSGAHAAISVGNLALSNRDLDQITSKNVLRFEPVSYTHEQLVNLAANADRGEPVALTFAGAPHELAMELNPSFDEAVLAAQPLVRPYAGTVIGSGGSVRLTVDLARDALDGIVHLSDQAYYVEPVWDAGGPLHIWYRSDDALVRILPHENPRGEVAPVDFSVAGPTPDLLAGFNVYNLNVVRFYYENGNPNPTSIANLMDDVYGNEAHMKDYTLAVTIIDTSTWPGATCGPGQDAFLHEFAATQLNNNEHAQLFTTNDRNAGLLGCAYMPGNHSWVEWSGTDKQKQIVGLQEMSHNYGLDHDDVNRLPNGHWSIMHSAYDEANTDASFTAKNRSDLWAAGNTTLFREADIWTGSDTSGNNVRLTQWYIHHPKTAAVGSSFTLKRTWAAGSGTVQLDDAFVGARDCGNESCNRDFGYLGAQTLTTSSTTNWWYNWSPSAGARTWTFWPAYRIGSGYGPGYWHSIQVYVN